MLRRFRRFDETRNEVRLDFFEPPESLLARLPELSGTQLPMGRGLIPRSRVTVEGDELRVSQFGRRLMRGRVESQPQGCSLILNSSAPLLKVAVYLWWFTAICGIISVAASVLQGYLSDQSALDSFIFASLVGSLVYPALWGRRWEFRRIAAALSERLKANNNSELQSVSHESSLARRGAWWAFLSAFLWAPVLVINGFEMPLASTRTLTAPWVNWQACLSGSVEIEGAMLLLMPLIGWAFVGGGAACGHLTARLQPSHGARLRQWTTTLLAVSVSLFLCWSVSGNKTLNRVFDVIGFTDDQGTNLISDSKTLNANFDFSGSAV